MDYLDKLLLRWHARLDKVMDDANFKLSVHKRGRDMNPRLIKRVIRTVPNNHL